MLRKFLLVLLRRIAIAVPILLVVSMMLFTALRVLPVDPAAMSMPPNATREEIEQAVADYRDGKLAAAA